MEIPIDLRAKSDNLNYFKSIYQCKGLTQSTGKTIVYFYLLSSLNCNFDKKIKCEQLKFLYIYLQYNNR